MFSRFLPHEADYFEYFDQHAALIVKAAVEFHSMVSAETWTYSNSPVIKEIEHQADQVTHLCMESLHKTFITPIDRDDVFRLISQMDDIIDCIDEAFEKISTYKLAVMNPAVRHLAHVVVRSSQQVKEAVGGLRKIGDGAAIRKNCTAIHNLEIEADALLREAVGRLFEDQPDTRLVIKWKEIFENLEQATDHCDHVSDVIQGIILEHG